MLLAVNGFAQTKERIIEKLKQRYSWNQCIKDSYNYVYVEPVGLNYHVVPTTGCTIESLEVQDENGHKIATFKRGQVTIVPKSLTGNTVRGVIYFGKGCRNRVKFCLSR